MIVGYSRAAAFTATDPNFSSVKLLMGFEGPNQSVTTGMADESSAAHGIPDGTNSFFSSVSTLQKRWGSSSLRMQGNVLTYLDHSDWDLGSGLFTVEMYIYPTALSGSVVQLIGQWGFTPNLGWVLYIDTGNHLGWNVSTTGSDNLTEIIGSATIADNAWYHVAIDYDGSKYRLYQDGVMVGSSITPRTIFNAPSTLSIAAVSNGGAFWFYGHMDEIRLTKGVARYASDGGFTLPTRAYPRS